MKKVIVFRHGDEEDLGLGYKSWALSARLLPSGFGLMGKVATRHKELLKKCNFFYSSFLIRAQESLYAMMQVLGFPVSEFDDEIKIVPGLWAYYPNRWTTDDPDYTVTKAWKKNPAFFEDEGRIYLISISEIASRIPNGSSALCISHSGIMDAGLATAKKQLGGKGKDIFIEMKDLKEGEGVIYTLDDNNNRLIGVEELRHP